MPTGPGEVRLDTPVQFLKGVGAPACRFDRKLPAKRQAGAKPALAMGGTC